MTSEADGSEMAILPDTIFLPEELDKQWNLRQQQHLLFIGIVCCADINHVEVTNTIRA